MSNSHTNSTTRVERAASDASCEGSSHVGGAASLSTVSVFVDGQAKPLAKREETFARAAMINMEAVALRATVRTFFSKDALAQMAAMPVEQRLARQQLMDQTEKRLQEVCDDGDRVIEDLKAINDSDPSSA